MNLLIIIISIIFMINVIFIFGLGFMGYIITKELTKKRKLNESLVFNEIYSNSTSLETILDDFISSTIDQYRVMHPDLFNDYINEKTQTEITSDIIKLVLTRISPILIGQLTLIYNTAVIHEVIVEKVTLTVLGLVIENNNEDISELLGEM